jgi:hypothetical protein
MFKRQTDLRSQPVEKIVALGESTTWGYSVSSKESCWVSQVTHMLEEFQGNPIELINQGIGSNVLTPAVPRVRALGQARRMPQETLIGQFSEQYGNGPDQPSFGS